MRCLNCRHDGLTADDTLCPNCRVSLPSLFRDLLPPGTRLRSGAFEIAFALGRGGFGITYQAVHTGLHRPVAIKEFYPNEYAQRDAAGKVRVPADRLPIYQRALLQFLHEGQVLGRLKHPGVVTVHDCFHERETAYLVMELLEGRTLLQELDAQPDRRLPPERVRDITEQLVEALTAVHADGVYHLDIKPANVLLAGNQAILIDFGAARRQADTESTRAFTVEYAAPEVILGEEVGPESDLFELGMLLHEMLTGVRLPPALSRVHSEPWSPADLPAPWDELLSSALSLQRADRPASVRAWWRGGADPHGPAVFRVSQRGGADFSSIGEAVHRAAPGDRVVVQPGLYQETLVLDKDIEILGEGSREEIILQANDSSCLVLRGPSALVQGLTIRGQCAGGGKEYVAIDIERGRLQLENCTVTTDSLSCIAARGAEARPVIRNCLIHRGAEGGLLFLRGASGVVEDCDIAEHALVGVAVRDGAAPTLRRCRIHHVGGVGVLVYHQGAPVLEDCTLEETRASGIEIRTGGAPVLRDCRILSCEEAGVLVHQEGAGTLERCTIQGNRLSGIEVRSDGAPTVRACRILDNAWYGVCVHNDGGGTLEDNELSGNGRGPWFLDDGTEVRRDRNRESP
jgi:parallel beta-helix repeat protein